MAYTLAHLWPELVPVLLNLAFSFPLALNALMILTIDLLTEQGPAISLAYERAEAAVMTRRPRNLKTDRLVTSASLFYSYFIAGIPNAAVCMYAFFLVYIRSGVSVKQLAFSVDHGYWAYPPFVPSVNATGGYSSGGTDVPLLIPANGGKSLDAIAQWNLFCVSQSAWYITLVMNQFWHIWNCRTRTVSIVSHGLFTNVVTIYGVIAEVAIAVGVVYIPAFHSSQNTDSFQTAFLPGIYWTVNLMCVHLELSPVAATPHTDSLFSHPSAATWAGSRCTTRASSGASVTSRKAGWPGTSRGERGRGGTV